MSHSKYDPGFRDQKPWNAGRKLGAKRALKPRQVWAIRFWLDRELAPGETLLLSAAEIEQAFAYELTPEGWRAAASALAKLYAAVFRSAGATPLRTPQPCPVHDPPGKVSEAQVVASNHAYADGMAQA